ncbi:MAG: hypothetical protein ABI222_11445 [Opitutaceae bacterium]
MLLQAAKYNPASEKARAAAFNAPINWIALEKRFPAPNEYVLVKMDDETVEIGHWDSARASWSHSPFERWGMPMAWAALPPQHGG